MSPFLCFLLIRRAPRPPLFPYTTLFRSGRLGAGRPKNRCAKALACEHSARPASRSETRQPAAIIRGPCHSSQRQDRKSTRLNSSHDQISYAVFCLKKKKTNDKDTTHKCS